MNTTIRTIASAVLITLATAAQAQTGRDIAQKVKDRPDGDTRRSEMVMKLVNKRGSVRERKLVSYSPPVPRAGQAQVRSRAAGQPRSQVSYQARRGLSGGLGVIEIGRASCRERV